MMHFQSLIDVLEHYNATIGEDEDFLDKTGILMEEVESDRTEPDYYDLKSKYNLKKALIARNRSITVSFLKGLTRQYMGLYGMNLKISIQGGHIST